ncbi:hypothetical protein GMMP15_560111 [Candidatus Magnetomoraceae bacterium gMMP-15]
MAGHRIPLIIRSDQLPIPIDDPEIEKRVDALGAISGPLHGII